jgi:hypothetical protein
MKLGAVAVASAASLALTAGPAVASTQASTTGREVIYGALHNKAAWDQGGKANPKVPVKFRGVVRTRGVVGLGSSKSKTRTLRTRAGKFTVRLSHSHTKAKVLNPAICRLQYAVTAATTMVGSKSTGAFAGATGRGKVRVIFTFNYPKRSNGKCNYSNSAVPSKHGGLISFQLIVPALMVH